MSAMPLMIAVLCVMAIAYRFYSAFLAARVATLDDLRTTPAVTREDGVNYHPTNKWVLFGHHFAAISGAGNRWRRSRSAMDKTTKIAADWSLIRSCVITMSLLAGMMGCTFIILGASGWRIAMGDRRPAVAPAAVAGVPQS